jgi:hypothetical protein
VLLRLAVSIVLSILLFSAPTLAETLDRNLLPLDSPYITVYHSPSCSCCHHWIAHLQEHGFQVRDVKVDEVESIKRQVGLPPSLESCHTAIAYGYSIEGHVPADDIKHFLQAKTNAAGLAVPQMPAGSPGMEMGDRKDPFSVLAFDRDGKTSVFSSY